jgi:hypothetical protein
MDCGGDYLVLGHVSLIGPKERRCRLFS